jgi:hypothetical protein
MMDSVHDYRWSGVTFVGVVSKHPESVDCCVVAVYLHDVSSIILDTFCKALSHDLEADISFIVVESEVQDQRHLDHAYHLTFEVMPENLELAQQHAAVEEAANQSIIISGSKLHANNEYTIA